MIKESDYILYTDGSCSGNPGPGGWGIVIIQSRSSATNSKTHNWDITYLQWSESHTTNNRMELKAVIEGLKWLRDKHGLNIPQLKWFEWFDFGGDLEDRKQETGNRKQFVDIYLDSQYVKQGIEEWIHTWKRKGWKTSGRKLVANIDLRQELDILVWLFDINRHWVKGHVGNKYNEIADQLATGLLKL